MLPSGIHMRRHAYKLNNSNNKKTELLLIISTTSEFTHRDSKHTVEVPVHHVYCGTYSLQPSHGTMLGSMKG